MVIHTITGDDHAYHLEFSLWVGKDLTINRDALVWSVDVEIERRIVFA